MLVLLVWTHLAAMAAGFILTATYWPADKELKRSYEEFGKALQRATNKVWRGQAIGK